MHTPLEKRLALIFVVIAKGIDTTSEMVSSALTEDRRGNELLQMLIEHETAKVYCFWSLVSISNHYRDNVPLRNEFTINLISFFKEHYHLERDDIQKYIDADGTKDQYLLFSRSIFSALNLEPDAVLMLEITSISTQLFKVFLETFKKALDFSIDE